MKADARYYKEILLSELLPALGCTEPVTIALCTSRVREVLGVVPDNIELYCSGNIIKNVRAVVVPNSGGRKGLEIAAALGIFGGRSDKRLEVLASITDKDIQNASEYVSQGKISIHLVKDEPNLYLRAEGFSGNDKAVAEIKYDHTHFNLVSINGEIIESANIQTIDDHVMDLDSLNLEDIYEFADTFPIMNKENNDLREVLEKQIDLNYKIGCEGILHSHGAEIGRTILFGNTTNAPEVQGIAFAAAGSDARMTGSSLPVVINSGSGNQGITLSVPLTVYAKEQNIPHEKLMRAVILSNLTAIHQKRFIGKLSAFCGVVSASAATGAGMAYLKGMNFDQICKVIVNTLCTSGGMVCDGAKPSCAAKIAVSLNTALMAVNMANMGKSFQNGDGLVADTAEETIRNVGRMARVGMKSTDEEILNIMIEENQRHIKSEPPCTPCRCSGKDILPHDKNDKNERCMEGA